MLIKKRTVALFLLLSGIIITGINSAFAVSFLKFEREFSGKGSTDGAFSPNIHVAFDAEHDSCPQPGSLSIHRLISSRLSLVASVATTTII